MSKKEKEILNNLLARVYDLILNPDTSDDERSILIEFKNSIENNKDLELETMKLANNLRLLALSKFKYKENLTSEVGKLYMDINSIGFAKAEFGGGLSVIGHIF